MDTAFLRCPLAARNLAYDEFEGFNSKSCRFHPVRYLRRNPTDWKPCQKLSASPSRGWTQRVAALPDVDDFFWEKDPTPILDTIDAPIHLKNLSSKVVRLSESYPFGLPFS
nr:unnamed protein product [Digitaria exilis]